MESGNDGQIFLNRDFPIYLTTMNFLILIPIILIGVVLLLLLLYSLIKKFRNRYDLFQQAIGRENIIEATQKCNFFGQKSRGKSQIRGNGFFALTDEEIFFELFVAKRVFRIYYSNILEMKIQRWFLGKSMERDLLVIRYLNEKKEEDEIGFLLKDPRLWMEKISMLLNPNKE